MSFRPFYTTSKPYIKSGAIDLDKNINSITFINKGANPATINPLGITLAQNDSIAITGNSGDVDKTYYKVLFAQGTGNLLVITQIYYD